MTLTDKLSAGSLSMIGQLENQRAEIDELIDKVKGRKVLICGYCYRSIEDHKQYPTDYCYPATQMYIYLSEWTKGGDPRWPLDWHRDTDPMEQAE